MLMAQNKKSFIAYSDWKDTFDSIPDEIAGKLIKHIFAYVNDENPTTDDYVINGLFANIRNTLKRDLEKWDKQYNQRVEAGKKSAEVRKRNATTVNERSISSTVSVSVSDSVNVNVNKDVYISKIQEKFYQSLIQFVNDFDREDIRKFYEYWSEPNKSMTKIKWQLEKTWDTKRRLNRWTKNKFNEKTRKTNNRGFECDTTQQAIDSVRNGFE